MKPRNFFVFFFLMCQFSSLQLFSIGDPFEGDKNSIVTIGSKILKNSLDQSFPRILQYQWVSTGDVIYGQEDMLTHIKINDKLYSPKVIFRSTKNTSDYLLVIPEISVLVKI